MGNKKSKISSDSFKELSQLIKDLDKTAVQLSKTMDQACSAFKSLGIANPGPYHFDDLHLDSDLF